MSGGHGCSYVYSHSFLLSPTIVRENGNKITLSCLLLFSSSLFLPWVGTEKLSLPPFSPVKYSRYLPLPLPLLTPSILAHSWAKTTAAQRIEEEESRIAVVEEKRE